MMTILVGSAKTSRWSQMPNNRIEIALPLVGQGPQAALRLSAPHACRYMPIPFREVLK
jgi:hypothetical protein